MDSLNKAKDLQDLHKRLSWQILVAKGVNKEGGPLCYSPNRSLVMTNLTTEIHSQKTPHPLNFRLSATLPDGSFGVIHLNDPRFLTALAQAITDKLPDLLDDALVLVENQGKEAFQAAEKELQSSQRRLEALRPEIKTQRELI